MEVFNGISPHVTNTAPLLPNCRYSFHGPFLSWLLLDRYPLQSWGAAAVVVSDLYKQVVLRTWVPESQSVWIPPTSPQPVGTRRGGCQGWQGREWGATSLTHQESDFWAASWQQKLLLQNCKSKFMGPGVQIPGTSTTAWTSGLVCSFLSCTETWLYWIWRENLFSRSPLMFPMGKYIKGSHVLQYDTSGMLNSLHVIPLRGVGGWVVLLIQRGATQGLRS